MPYTEVIFRQGNTYTQATTLSPIFYVKGNIFGIYPATDSTNNITLYYYKQPSAIASGVNPTLGAETHEAIIYYGFAMLLQKDGREEAQFYFSKFLQELTKLG